MTYSAILHVIDANEPLSIAKEETLLLVLIILDYFLKREILICMDYLSMGSHFVKFALSFFTN